MFDSLQARPADPLLKLIGLFQADPRGDKLDLGVGVYADETGRTPVFAAVKAAEARLLAEQPTKAYVGARGDLGFVAAMRELLLSSDLSRTLGDRFTGLQSTGGTGALRLGADLLARAGATSALFGTPTWPNHAPVFEAAGLTPLWCDYFDAQTQTVKFEAYLDALDRAEPGQVVVLHGCCHNPTGADLSPEQWDAVAHTVARRGLFPFIDMAYQGFGRGLDEDAYGLRAVLAVVPEAVVSVSCAKNMGLYRERAGAVFFLCEEAAAADRAMSNMLAISRANYSMPPDHGAAIARIVLETPDLAASWREELAGMRARILGVRRQLAEALVAAGLPLGHIANQTGMFSTLPFSPTEVLELRGEFGVYMTDAGRINVAGLTAARIEALVSALAATARKRELTAAD